MAKKVGTGDSLLDVVQGSLQNEKVREQLVILRESFADLIPAPPQEVVAAPAKKRKHGMTPLSESEMSEIVGGRMYDIAPSDDPVLAVLEQTFEETERVLKEIKRQAKISFDAALILILCGTLLVFGGIYALYRNNMLTGWITTAAGAVMDVLSGGIMVLYKSVNKRLDEANHDLLILSKVRAQYAIIQNISNQTVRTKELRKLIGSMYEHK